MRIQNEGAGKSSWWVINPDAKPGRNPRRRANTMEAATKVILLGRVMSDLEFLNIELKNQNLDYNI